MKNVPYKRQHYIPECYLKGFSQDDKKLIVYNKTTNGIYPQAFHKVAFIKDLYSIPEKYIDKNKFPEFHEKYFELTYFAKGIESEYNKLLIEIKRKAEEWAADQQPIEVLTRKDRDLFAAYIAIQYLRLPAVREMHYTSYQKSSDVNLEFIKSFCANQLKDVSKEFVDTIKYKHDENYGAVIHSKIYTDPEIINPKQDQLRNKVWAFLVSPENNLFTSDNPIIMIPKTKSSYYPGNFGTKGAQIIFPISGKILLSMWDAEDFNFTEYEKDQFQPITDADVYLNNSHQYANAINQIYQSTNDFKIVEDLLCRNNGKHIYMDQPKINVYTLKGS